MKKIFTLFFLLLLTLTTSQNLTAQTCSDGAYQWTDALDIFENNGCNTALCHGGGASGLDLTTFDGFNSGGTNCAGDISAGTTLVDIIQMDGVSCADGDIEMSMNSRITNPVSQTDIDALQAWIDAGSFELCRGEPLDDGVCDSDTSVDNLSDPGQATLCNDGSDALTLTAPAGSLPDVQIVVEVNATLITISDDGSFDTSILMEGDEVCYTAFTFDLAAINELLDKADGLCPILDCDETFGIMGVNQAIADLVAGVNDGVPGLNNLQEALDFAGSFGNPIGSVQTAGSTLDALNEQIGALLGNVCYASSQALCLNVVDCSGPCSGDEVATTLSVDMSCSGTDMRPPVVAVPVDGALVEVVTMDDADGDDIWEAIICVAPGTEYEYKYVTTGFAEEENLVDDAIGGATCVGNTDFSAYANRVITIPEGGGVLPTDTYGSCGTCDNPPVSVTFNVDMGCSDIAAGTQIAVTGPFTGWCDGCAPMADPEGDNIWASNTYAFPADDSGCIFIEYLYQAPNWGNAESLPTNGEDLSLCPGNVNIVDSYANHLITICNAESTDVIVNDYWNTCFAPTEPTAGCDDGDCSNGVETWDGCACVEGTTDEIPVCDDGDCTNGLEIYNETTCSCDPGTPPVDPGCDDGDCSNGVETWDGCECVAGEAPVDPGCDDGDCSNGVETWDGCQCVDGVAGEIPMCDDGDCSNGVETYDEANCECVPGEAPVDPGCDDGDCSNGLETWDGCECVAGETPVDPGCDDGDCSNGVETWDGCECVAGVAGEIPMCDDGDCSNGVETYDADNCVCVAGTAPVDPGCDDGDCSNGVETWDGCDCVAGTPGETPECDDGDCSNGVETYDAENCECVPGVAPMDPGCDDGICSNGLEVWDGCECVLPGIPEPLVCDDGNCGNGLETYNEITCSCDPGTPPTCADGETLNEDCDCVDVLICEDPCATNFGASEACEPYEMTCPEDTCFEQYTWDAEGCECIVAVVDYFCDDDNECTNDYVDEVICECVNEEIPGCGDPDPTCPTPGVIEDCGYELSQERLNAIAAFVVSETGGSFPHGGMGLTADQTIRDIFTSDGNVGNEINPGFLITKHTYALDSSGNKGDLLVTFAMLKHFEGYWEDSNDWEYIMIPADPAVDYTVNPNGILANAAVSGNVHDMNPGCISCHNGAGGGDQLFSND